VAYAIDVLPRALDDIRGAVRRIYGRVSPASAARWHTGVYAKIRTLAHHPERCPLADDAADLGIDLRELLYGRKRNVYRILFTIDGRTVNVHRVRHAAQDRLAPDDVDPS
jgi:plasmid stabilization system protein ParE